MNLVVADDNEVIKLRHSGRLCTIVRHHHGGWLRMVVRHERGGRLRHGGWIIGPTMVRQGPFTGLAIGCNWADYRLNWAYLGRKWYGLTERGWYVGPSRLSRSDQCQLIR